MFTKKIKYTDYNGVEREETCHFNLNKAEVMELEMSESGGWTEAIARVIERQDAPSLIKIFKDLILKSYGIKSADGKRFIKSKEISEEFAQTEAYSELFMELATNDELAANFIARVIPSVASEKEAGKLAIANKVD